MRTMLTALGSRRESLKNEDGQKGFTLIELLVVVIIIGILAAIAIPVFMGVQSNAKDSATKSDLTNLKTAVVALSTEKNGVLPATIALADLSKTITLDPASYATAPAVAPTITVTTDATTKAQTFCIVATGANGNQFHITDSKSPTTGPCA